MNTKLDQKTHLVHLARLMNEVPSARRTLMEDSLGYFLGLANLTVADAPWLLQLRPLSYIEPMRDRRLNVDTDLAHYVDVGTREQPRSEGTFITSLKTLQRACGLSLNSMRIYSYTRRDPRTGGVRLPFRLIPDGQLLWTPSTEDIVAKDQDRPTFFDDYLAKLLAPRVGTKPRKY